ncbi:MAG: hypothetical protein NZ611_03600 [Bacteroidia bacterium]|nr:hypothetical protein [Bacteroidia bacterium]
MGREGWAFYRAGLDWEIQVQAIVLTSPTPTAPLSSEARGARSVVIQRC